MSDAHKDRLPRVPAQAAEGDVRATLSTLVDDIHKMRVGLPCNGYADQQLERVQGRLFDILAALSAEGSANTAAADLQALASEDRRVEDMRERAAKAVRAQIPPWVDAKRGDYWDGYRDAIDDAEEDVRALPLTPEDQEKAAATPTIADPVFRCTRCGRTADEARAAGCARGPCPMEATHG